MYQILLSIFLYSHQFINILLKPLSVCIINVLVYHKVALLNLAHLPKRPIWEQSTVVQLDIK